MLSAIKTWTVARKLGDEVRSKHVVATLQFTCTCFSSVSCNIDFIAESVEGLTSNDLGTVLEEVVDVSAQWYSLGLQLRVNVGALNRIRAQFSDPQDQLSAMLKAWLNSSCHLSWGNLISALRSRTMQAHQLASQLERKYGLLLHRREEAEGSSTASSRADVPPAFVSEQSETPSETVAILLCLLFVCLSVCLFSSVYHCDLRICS